MGVVSHPHFGQEPPPWPVWDGRTTPIGWFGHPLNRKKKKKKKARSVLPLGVAEPPQRAKTSKFYFFRFALGGHGGGSATPMVTKEPHLFFHFFF